MKPTSVLIIISLAVFSLLLSPCVYAGDLDDKIGNYTDDPIEGNNKLGGDGINIKYTIMKAKSQAKVTENSATNNGTKDGSKSSSSNINSVEMGAGSKVRGDIIIIDQSKGKKTAVAGN